MNLREQYIKYLELAKKRNKKIIITDIAISKVPRTKVYGFTAEENAKIQAYHKELLRRAKVQNNSNEVAVVISRDSKDIKEDVWLYGEESIVGFDGTPAEYKIRSSTARKLMVLHNHPCTQGYSYSDIALFANNLSIYGITIVTNTGETHILVKKEMFNYTLYRQFVTMIKEEALNKYSSINDEKYKLKVVQEIIAKKVIDYADELNLYYRHGGGKNDR